MIDKLRNPKKSIFSSPNSSKVVMVNCVTTASLFLASGTYLQTGRSVITTPAACVEAFLGMPSNFFAMSINSLTCGSESYKFFKSWEMFSARSNVIFNSIGTNFATESTFAYGIAIALPTSRIEPRAAIVPNVII